MATISRSLRVPEEMERSLEREFRRRGVKEWTTGVLMLLEEALRMSRAPGIVFVDGPTGRRAAVAGTGIEVWEVIASWEHLGRDYERLRASYEWLAEPQLRAALGYYQLYPEEVEERIALEEEWTPERIRSELPFTRAPGLE